MSIGTEICVAFSLLKVRTNCNRLTIPKSIGGTFRYPLRLSTESLPPCLDLSVLLSISSIQLSLPFCTDLITSQFEYKNGPQNTTKKLQKVRFILSTQIKKNKKNKVATSGISYTCILTVRTFASSGLLQCTLCPQKRLIRQNLEGISYTEGPMHLLVLESVPSAPHR